MDFINYFGNVFTPYHLMLLLGGTTAGLILGALPGLSPTMAVALIIPFTFHMQPDSGLILLGAMYTATVAGGAISAILVNVPGAPANIATALDGHELARQGRASEALHYCFFSSFVGGIFGIVILIFFTPPLADLALKFGPTELFWIAILGITVIGTIGSKSVLKGLMAGLFGLAISTIGDNPMLGEQRFVYSDHLESGIHIVAALIGLFALPQILTLLEECRKQKKGSMYALSQSRWYQSAAYNFRRVKALTIGSFVGAIVGVIPGAGGQIAGLVAYDQAKKMSANPQNFGNGEPDGIIAAESANNAMVGPSLVPLLTLSIPGSPTAAVLLGGLLIHGLFPGPDLFTQHAEVIWTFIDSLIVAQIFMLVIGLFLSRHSGWIMKVPPHYMAASILILAVFGTYSIQSSFSDVLIMMVLGVAMYFGSKFGFGPAPVVLGIILGPIAEDNFLQGQLIGEAGDGVVSYFFTGTINVVLILATFGSIVYSVYASHKMKKRAAA
ncbi:MAG: tripartite tricarboxylate transporter permease [Gammaproteobacteria bacterium]|nr:tripartite tricarboxylate transporter permease [Gammaproteobacteria bacterium]